MVHTVLIALALICFGVEAFMKGNVVAGGLFCWLAASLV